MSAEPASEPDARPRRRSFPKGTPLDAFCAWNERRLARDRRFILIGDICKLLTRYGGDDGSEISIAHLAGRPAIRWRFGPWRAFAKDAEAAARRLPASAAPQKAALFLVERLLASFDSVNEADHAAVFTAFEQLAEHVDLAALARPFPRAKPAPAVAKPRRILVIKLGALGDFVQALAAIPAVRRHHREDRLTLLTTPPYVEFARATGLFDEILVDRRPKPFDVAGWLALRRALRSGNFDRVYDLQTSDRSSFYAWFFPHLKMPQWSGIAWRCSHPHANRDRDLRHTLDRQAEQLLMAGIHPVAPWAELPPGLAASHAAGFAEPYALLIPGSSPRRTEKRWPAARYGMLVQRLVEIGLTSVIVGTRGEEEIADAICKICPAAVDLVGRTNVLDLAALARGARLAIGNDTGATHVAAAAGKPVIALFSRASDPRLCAPRGRAVRILACRDLADLAVDDVFSAAIELLDAQAPQPVAPA